MSVLVKGIKMPQSCGGCEFLCYPFHEPVCFLTREIIVQPRYKSLRQTLLMKKDNCPLVEVEDEKPTTRYCDRNICASNEINGIGCDECEVTNERKV